VIVRAAVVFALMAATASAGELTSKEQRGKHLYLTGESAAGHPVTALLGDDQVEVAASAVPCAGCHGRNGRGKPEGGIRPSNVQWDALLHPQATDERTRAAYTRSLLKRAVTMGLDASANRLQTTMPRYRMAIDDLDDLLAYLEKLGSDQEPGVSDDLLRIGAVLPSGPAEQRAVQSALEAYFHRINTAGGIFGRRIDLRVMATAGTPEQRAAGLSTFIDGVQPFAIAAAWLSGADAALSAVAERGRVPTIAAFSADVPPDDRYVFRLLAGVREQSAALVAASHAAAGARIVLVADETGASAAARIRDDLTAAGHTRVQIAKTISEGAEIVLFLGAPSRLGALLAAAAAAPSPPLVLIPAAHSASDLTSAPRPLDGRILVALPSSPDDVTQEGAAELRALAVPPDHATACRLALAAARLLVDALRRSGRDLDRDALVATLETFYGVPTTLTPPITWSPGRHTGTRDVRVIALDLREKRWIDRGWWRGAFDSIEGIMPHQRPNADEYAPHQEAYVSLIEAPVLETLRAQEALILALSRTIDDQKAPYRYGPRKWSVREVVGHMADAERVYQYRALVLARGGETELRRWDPDGYVAHANFDARTVSDLADEMLVVRRGTTALFASLDPEAWSRSGTLNGKPLSVRALAFIAAGHFQRHLNVLRERYGVGGIAP
jgi:ABC-type branched-subunit amino acid transport system substrate-binding protein